MRNFRQTSQGDMYIWVVQVATCHSAYMAGLLVGSFVSGWLGDKIGGSISW